MLMNKEPSQLTSEEKDILEMDLVRRKQREDWYVFQLCESLEYSRDIL